MTSPATAAASPGIRLSMIFLAALALVDLAFMGVHGLHAWSPWFKSWMFSIEQDRSLAELFQYCKQFLLVLCLALAFLRSRLWVFAAWSALFGFLLFDDMLELHERFGRFVGPQLGLPTFFGLRPDDYGELAYAMLLGLAVVPFVLTTLRRSDAISRQVSADLSCLLAALAFFAVVFDALHTMAYFRAPAIADAVAMLEDGGEMLVMSLITAYAFDTWRNCGRPRLSVWTWVRGRWAPAPA